MIGIEPERIETGIGVSEAVAKGVRGAVEAAGRELAGKLACGQGKALRGCAQRGPLKGRDRPRARDGPCVIM